MLIQATSNNLQETNMTKRTAILAATAFCALLTTSAVAQTNMLKSGNDNGVTPPHQDAPIRVQSSVNLTLPGPTNDGEDAQKLRDRAKRMVYDMAAHECDLLRETLAKDCRLEAVSSNVSGGRQNYGQQVDGYNVNGQLTLVVTPK
jgi:hypothetical protein